MLILSPSGVVRLRFLRHISGHRIVGDKPDD
jgi:hypothetical protein